MSGPYYESGSRVVPSLFGREGVIASLIDKDNVALAYDDTTQNGRLSLKSGSDKWRFAIGQDSSSFSSVSSNGDTLLGGLSQFFGLNDLIVRRDGDINLWYIERNAALNLKIRDDIAAKLEKFVQYGDEKQKTTSTPLYSVSAGDSSNVHEIAKAIDTPVSFVLKSGDNIFNGNILEHSQQVFCQ